MKQPAIVVGRHVPDIGRYADVFEVSQADIEWPLDETEAEAQWNALTARAHALGGVVILQNIPTCLADIITRIKETSPVPVYVVVSEPGKRPAGAQYETLWADKTSADCAALLAKFCNPRCSTQIDHWGDLWRLTVTADPPAAFKFHSLRKIA